MRLGRQGRLDIHEDHITESILCEEAIEEKLEKEMIWSDLHFRKMEDV